MKLYFLIFLVVLATLSTSSNTPKSDVQKEEEELLSDNTGVQNGSDVIMVNPGPLTIMLNGNELVFEVCSSLCDSNFLVCYESDPVGQNVTEQCDSKCGFYVLTNGDTISVMKGLTLAAARPKLEACDHFKMVFGQISFREFRIPSCSPKIVNGIVKLNIQNASSECPVSIKNATIAPETTTPLSTTTHGIKTNLNGSSGNDTTTSENGGFIENYWWIFLITAVVLIIIVVVVTVICCRRSKKEKKQTAAAALPPRKIQGSKSPIVVQSSTEDTHGQPQRQIPTSLMQPSSILSRKSLLWSKKEIKSEETDLTSMKPTA